MNKSLFTLATLSAFAAGAYAQSSVTLFGVLDVNAAQIKNGSAGSLAYPAASARVTVVADRLPAASSPLLPCTSIRWS